MNAEIARCAFAASEDFQSIMRAFISVLALLGAARAADWEPGSSSTFAWPPLEPMISVRVPNNYTTDRKWPIVFHYHTQGMEPNAIVPLAYSNNRDFITVAMAYTTPDLFTKERDFFEREFQILRDVRDHLVSQQLLIDVDRTYLGGDGAGGWYASYFADLFGNELAGVYLSGAGTFGASKIRGVKFQQPGKPVYIGAGQIEANYSYALNGIAHFRGLGGRVTFDEYTAQNHIVPIPQVYTAERLRQWFQIEANRPTPAAGRELVADWQALIERKLGGLEEPIDRYLFYDHLPSFPFYAALPADFRRKLDGEKQALMKTEVIAREVGPQTVFEQLNHAELQDFGIINRRRLAHNYASLYEKYPDTHWGKRAAMAVIRLRDLVENPDRYDWSQNLEARQEFLDAAASRPLPELPDDKLIGEMQRVATLVYLN